MNVSLDFDNYYSCYYCYYCYYCMLNQCKSDDTPFVVCMIKCINFRYCQSNQSTEEEEGTWGTSNNKCVVSVYGFDVNHSGGDFR